jgi:hypothetical protein
LALPVIIAASAVVLLAGLVSGLTGFGFALISVPLLVLFLPAKPAVALVWMLGTLCDIAVAVSAFRWAQPKRIWPLMVAGVVGIQIGGYLLLILSPETLKLWIGVVITLSSLGFLLGFRRQIANEKAACAPVGLASGLLGGTTGMSGPPVILFLTNQGLDKRTFRANLATYFLVIDAVRAPLLLKGGLINHATLTWAAYLLAALAVGTLAGIRLVHHVDEALFRRVALIIVLGAGLVSVVTGLGLF